MSGMGVAKRLSVSHWFLLALSIVMLALPSSSEAQPGVVIRDTYEKQTSLQPYQNWADASKMPTPPITVHIITGSPAEDVCFGNGVMGCGGVLGWIVLRTKVKPVKPWTLRDVFLHELGHQFYANKMGDGDKWEFVGLYHARQWMRENDLSAEQREHFTSEWFAEGYRLCSKFGIRLPRRDPHTAYGYGPTPPEHRSICRLIRRAGAESPGYAQPATYYGSPFVVEDGEVEWLIAQQQGVVQPLS